MYQIVDFKTKKQVEPTNFVYTSDEGPWEVMMDIERIRSRVNADYFKKSPPLISKYLPFMPVRDYSHFVSLGEGTTPLIESNKIGPELGIKLYYKLESQNPTGSFKDRGSAVELTVARELNVKGIAVASTGNMAASCSCYAALAQIPCFVFVPEGTPPGKLAQVISFGGRIVQVKGSYGDAAQLAQRVAEERGFYLAGDYAFRVEGQKTAAFEIVDQLYFQVPDMVVIPLGCGTNMASYAKGFQEYNAVGLIDQNPRLIGVQASGAQPIVNSYNKRTRNLEPVSKVESIASAIAINSPLDGLKALDAIYNSNGAAYGVTDQEMLAAQYLLSKDEGLFVETSSAATLAAILKMSKAESIQGQRIVCVLTGSGLKDPNPILKVAIKPPTIYPQTEAFLSLFDNSFFEGKTISLVDREEIIFRTEPTNTEIKQRLSEYFSAHYADEYVERINKIICGFLKKGKPITFSDFQDIVQDALESLKHRSAEVFAVSDFEVTTGKDRQAHATVKVSVNGQQRQAESVGVGPVDAVISALRVACGEIEFSLNGYKVDIRSQGTDAVVYVELTLKKEGIVSAGSGASPDIIQASIEAFEEAYNGFR